MSKIKTIVSKMVLSSTMIATTQSFIVSADYSGYVQTASSKDVAETFNHFINDIDSREYRAAMAILLDLSDNMRYPHVVRELQERLECLQYQRAQKQILGNAILVHVEGNWAASVYRTEERCRLMSGEYVSETKNYIAFWHQKDGNWSLAVSNLLPSIETKVGKEFWTPTCQEEYRAIQHWVEHSMQKRNWSYAPLI